MIIIDPGHGGKDPGAVGTLKGKRYYEKDIALHIGKKMAAALNRIKGVKAYMTRQSDRFVTLRGRSQLAHDKKANLFISVHADALPSRKKARGASVYILSEKGADMEVTRWLRRQNATKNFLGSSSKGNIKDLPKPVQEMVLDLSAGASIDIADRIGDSLLDSFQQQHIPLLHKETKKAAFVVLKSPDIPSILIEVGFVSTPSELVRIKNPKFQERYAKALTEAVTTYLHLREARFQSAK